MWEKDDLKRLSNKELDDLLDKADWCDKTLLDEHDDRLFDGRIKFSEPIEDLEEFFKKRRELKQRKKAS